ncbi:MAG TPA: serine/threonine-protein kinase, partial [Candidatus Krumholzibacteria bacterium]|nr:serine/threonine-protein kinase [Candidatus Krumholzibacteria bacterium]
MIGSKLAHYEITALLGKGGMGEVYRARDTKLQREVAIKIVSPQLASDPERLARFAREARTLASLHHRRIASLFSIEEAEGRTFLVMELVEGMDLAERLGTHGAPSVGEALRIGLQITEGLEFAHEKGVVHRDLKPGNVKV